MSDGVRSQRSRHAEMSDGVDHFARLPDELVFEVLSFLSSREAVRTCFLGRRWRHLWRSAPAIRVAGEGYPFLLFMNGLLFGRNASASPLHLFEMDVNMKVRATCHLCKRRRECDHKERWEVSRYVDMWVHHALTTGRARVLTVCFSDQEDVLWMPRGPSPFTSKHLTRIHLDTVYLINGQMNFSCCPALISLTLVRCCLNGDALVSPTIKNLAIIGSGHPEKEPDGNLHIILNVPELRSLQISENFSKESFIQMLPWLTEEVIVYTDVDDVKFPA